MAGGNSGGDSGGGKFKSGSVAIVTKLFTVVSYDFSL
jgi:hypothetical protein